MSGFLAAVFFTSAGAWFARLEEEAPTWKICLIAASGYAVAFGIVGLIDLAAGLPQ